jgi:putative nucleotidyltransferase with HDIG domain
MTTSVGSRRSVSPLGSSARGDHSPSTRSLSRHLAFLLSYHAGVVTELPAVSPLARELACAPRSALAPGDTLLDAFRTDPFLSAKLLGTANSIYFNHHHEVVLSLEDALDRVGTGRAHQILRSSSPLPDGVGEEACRRYWAHCMSVAHCARDLTAMTVSAPFAANVVHLAAMVHDIGRLLALQYCPELLAEFSRTRAAEGIPLDAGLHAVHGAELARCWYLPQIAVAAIRFHHDPDACLTPRARWLCRVIAVSKAICAASVAGLPEVPLSAALQGWMRELQVDGTALGELRQKTGRIHEDCLRFVAPDPSNLVQPSPLRPCNRRDDAVRSSSLPMT